MNKRRRPSLRDLNRLSTHCYAAEETFTAAADRLEEALNRASWLTLRVYDAVWVRRVGAETRKQCTSCGQLTDLATTISAGCGTPVHGQVMCTACTWLNPDVTK
jgi:hypothetical protein